MAPGGWHPKALVKWGLAPLAPLAAQRAPEHLQN